MKNEKNEIMYAPLKNILDFIDDDKDLSTDEIKEELREYGINPEESIKRVKSMINNVINKERLSWQEKAKKNISDFKTIQIQSDCQSKTPEEINSLFNNVIQGDFGQDLQSELKIACRNLTNISTSDKAAFLNSLNILKKMKGKKE